MNRKVLVSLMVIGVVGAVAGGGTLAAFSDTETSPENVFVAGAVDLGIDITGGPYTGETLYGQGDNDAVPAFFDIPDIKPGDSYERTLSLHVENNDAYTCMAIEPTSNDENDLTEPEEEAGDTTESEGELAENMALHVWTDMGRDTPGAGSSCTADPGNNRYDPQCNEQSLWDAESEINGGQGIPTDTVDIRLADTTGNVFESSGPMVGEETYYIGVNYSLPRNTGNEIQTDSYTTDIGFTTEQARNNDQFVCDETPPPPGGEEEPGECGPIEGLEDGSTYTLDRDTGDGTETVEYGVVRDGKDTWVKFEDPETDGEENTLGENGEVESEVFEVTVNGGKEKVIVTTKAGSEQSGGGETKTLLSGEGDVKTDGLGFTLELVEIIDNGDGTFTYRIKVTSDDEGGQGSHALSHISFEFCKIQYQLDFAGGEVIQDLSSEKYHGTNRMVRFRHGNSADGLTQPSGNSDQVYSASGGEDCVDAEPIQLNSEKTEATVAFEVHDKTACQSVKLSFASYQKPYEGWIGSRADEQEVFDSVTDTFGPGEYSMTVDLP